jgi:putative glutamine amidotransferase
VSRRPVVGICAAVERATWGAWDVEVNLSQRTYSREVASAGAQPILLPPTEELTASPDEVVDLLDAVILAGGGDVDPASYGAVADERTANVRPDRDAFEIALANAAVERDLPLLGICRGMEILNVARGGDLIQHLETTETHLHTPGEFTDHEVVLEPGSLAARAAGGERLSVRSHHHQGIGALGEGLVASGRAVPDDVIEAIELPEATFCLGVIWHTEEELDSAVVRSFVGATRAGVASS